MFCISEGMNDGQAFVMSNNLISRPVIKLVEDFVNE